jgi:hypothetical protein
MKKFYEYLESATQRYDAVVHFGIGESGVSQGRRRVADKIKKDKKLKREIVKIERKLNLSRMKT